MRATRSDNVSEAERPDRLAGGRRVTVEDIRALAGPADAPLRAPDPQPHPAADRRGSPADDPVRLEGERQIERLTELAQHSGEPRGIGPGRPRPTEAAGCMATATDGAVGIRRARELLAAEAAATAARPQATAPGTSTCSATIWNPPGPPRT